MAGPVALVLVQHALSQEQLIDLEQWLYEVASNVEGQLGHWRTFWIKDVSLIGMIDDGQVPCSFGMVVEKTETEQDCLKQDGTMDEELLEELQEEQQQLAQHLGFVPEQQIVVFAGCNRRLDQRILGRLVLSIAEKCGGIIDFNGALRPPLKPGQSWDDVTLEDEERYVQELSLPGQVFPMHRTHEDGNVLIVDHLFDMTFLRAWLEHPHFYMVK